MIFDCPVETQAVVATIGPFVYGDQHCWDHLMSSFEPRISDLGAPVGAAFCAQPAYSALQRVLAQDVAGLDASSREARFSELLAQFDVPGSTLGGNPDERNWTVNQALFTPIDKLSGKGKNTAPDVQRGRALRRVVNAEVDCVIAGETGLLFIEGKLTSPLSHDTKLGLSQMRVQALNAAITEQLTGTTVQLSVLGVGRDELARNIKLEPKPDLRPRNSEIWARSDQLLKTVATLTWDRLHASSDSVPSPSSTWLRELGNRVKIFNKKDRSFAPIARKG